jgi:anion-transporting  ArsA/GET3 family ATPase
VVDTPPTRNAIDFLEAPARMADFFSSRFLRLLTAPARSRLVNMATRPFYQVADRILGSQFLGDISDFFISFQSMYDGFVQRSRAVERLLHDRRTTFMVVSTLEPAPASEAEFFIRALADRRLHLGAIVLNKVLPTFLLDTEALRTAERLAASAPDVGAQVAGALAGAGTDATQVERVLVEVAESFQRFHVVAQREAEEKAELGATADVVVTVPYFDSDIHDVAGLLALGEAVFA